MPKTLKLINEIVEFSTVEQAGEKIPKVRPTGCRIKKTKCDKWKESDESAAGGNRVGIKLN